MPPQVAASSGLDILSHAIESYTALPFAARPRPERPLAAPRLPGLESDQRRLVAAGAADGGRLPGARGRGSRRRRGPRQMLLAASYAGVGFGNAGVHLPHGMSYPVSGKVKDYRAPGYATRPSAGPARHLGDPERAGGVPLHRPGPTRRGTCRRPRRSAPTCPASPTPMPGKVLADRITWFMQRLGVPNGLAARSATPSPTSRALVEGTLPQHRVTKLSPRPASRRRPGRALRGRDDRVVTAAGRQTEGLPYLHLSGGRRAALQRPYAGNDGSAVC